MADQHAQTQAQLAFEKLAGIGAQVYKDPDEDCYDFLLCAQTHSGKQYASCELSYRCDNGGLFPEVVQILEQHSMMSEWVNPEVIGIWYEAGD